MAELSKDYTDKLFQEDSDQFDFTYNTSAWSQMEEMLDKESKRRRTISAIKYLIGVVLLIVFISIGFQFIGDSSTTKPKTLLRQHTPVALVSARSKESSSRNSLT